MRITSFLAGCVLACGLVACGSSAAEETARNAKAKTLSARFLIISGPGGRELFIAPTLTVIKRHGRVLAWTTPTAELTLRDGRRCYERYTELNRDDVRQQRDAAWPSTTMTDVELREREGIRVLTGREEHTESADTELEVLLDETGRVTRVRQRSAELGAVPAGKWQMSHYRYPTEAQFTRLLGSAPRASCD